ncbi:MAG: hypothetical protein RXP28_02295 [Nitrososphaeria archaeon]
METSQNNDEKKGSITLVTPNVIEAITSMRAFQELKGKLLDDNDVVQIEGRKYIKRSGWRKIALAFNISTEIIEVSREEKDGKYIVRVKARAVAPNGRVSEEIGVCDSSEFESSRLKASIHNIETKATTRALNRAISNLVGGGEVSAEEIIADDEGSSTSTQGPQPQSQPQPQGSQPQPQQTINIQWKQSRNPNIEYTPASTAVALAKQIEMNGGELNINGIKYVLSSDKGVIFRYKKSGSDNQ